MNKMSRSAADRRAEKEEIIALAERAEALHEQKGANTAALVVREKTTLGALQFSARYGDELERRKALTMVYYWGGAEASAELTRALRADESVVVRHEAAYYLGALRLPDCVQALIQALEDDEADLVRHEAAEALGDMGATVALPALKHVSFGSNEMLARTAKIAIEQLRRLSDRREQDG